MAIKVLDYEGLKVLSSRIKSLIDKKANTADIKTKLSQLSQDSSNRTVSDAEKTKWNAKAEKSYVDSKYNDLNKNKAEKIDLNSYVKKDGNKVLSDNNFSYDLKSKLDRISNKSEAELLNTIWDISYSDRIFNGGNLYEKLNSYAGTNLSSSIRNVDQLLASTTGWANFVNTNKAVDAIYNCSSALEKVFMNSDATSKLLDNKTNYEKLLNSSNGLMMAFNSEIATRKLISKDGFIDKLVNTRYIIETMIYSLEASKLVLNDKEFVNKIINSAIAMNAMVDTSEGMKLIVSMPVLWQAIKDNSKSIGSGTVTGKLIIISVGKGTTELYLPTGENAYSQTISDTYGDEGVFTTAFNTYVTKIYMPSNYSGRTYYFEVKEL